MDHVSTRNSLLLVAALTLAAAACGDGSDRSTPASETSTDETATVETPAQEWAPTPAEIERATEIGRDAAGRLAGSLMQRLSEELAQGGPEAAIEFCSDEAMELTGGVNAELDDLHVKRTSTRIRNPENAPDALERAALTHFEAEKEAGSLPESWVQVASGDELRYYQPLVVAETCTQCHGPADALQPEVRARLQELYPEDEALGYAPGDFRGLIRVTISREALEG